MTALNDNYTNPFDNETLTFVVLKNQNEQFSLWPTFAEEPGGWQRMYGPAERLNCLEFIDRNWKDGVLFPKTAQEA